MFDIDRGKVKSGIRINGNERVLIAMTDSADTYSTKYNDISVVSYANRKKQNVNIIGYGYVDGEILQYIADNTFNADGNIGKYEYTSTGDELYVAYQKMVPEPDTDYIKIRFRSLNEKASKATVYLSYGNLTSSFSAEYPDTE